MAKAFTTRESDDWDIVQRYDTLMYDPDHIDYFSQSHFTNFGYWTPETRDQCQACEDLMEQLMAMVPEKKGSILDVACGKGGTTRHLLKYYDPAAVTAINVSSKQLETARTAAPGCRFLLMDAANLDFEDSTFNNVICVEAAFHFDTRERFFRETARVLKPGGRLILTDILMSREAERSKPYRTEKNYLASPGDYRRLALNSGFVDAQVIDATEPCWGGCFWHAVRFIHERYLRHNVNQAGMQDFLRLTYRRAQQIQYYLLACLRKGGDG
ncbi:MAG: methyltransferase domain-containing protein [Planctomycetota bacterium]